MSSIATWYPWLKAVHVTAAIISLSGFLWRWVLLMRGSNRMANRWMRVWPHVNDTVLLASAIGLASLAGVAPWRDAWLGAKVVGLLLYIGLGMIALRHARSASQRRWAGVAAVGTFGFIVAAAWWKSPLGWLTPLLR